MTKNEWLITMAKEITVAKVSACTSSSTNKDTGKATADYLEIVYAKLKELNEEKTEN